MTLLSLSSKAILFRPHLVITMLPPLIPKTEKRFWRIFRSLLLPMSAFAFLLCLLGAVFTAFGEGTAIVNGREVRGVEGALACLTAFPIFAPAFTFIATFAVYSSRRKMKT